MAKRIVVCCDGTWATPDQAEDGQPCPTNVTKLALGIASAGKDRNGTDIEQRVFYHRGVGAGRHDRLGGGAFGAGLSYDILAAYRFIMGNFQPGDELFLLGFSRGAYTARSTAGLIRNAGILRRRFRGRLGDAYSLYRDRTATTNPRSVEATLFRRSFSHEARIHCIAVWDTVGALGIPLTGVPVVDRFNRRFAFHDTALSISVDNAFQALAIDEKRKPFAPALWQPQAEADGQRLEQVWFTGTHGDVGGGNRSTLLSDVALAWIVERTRSAGLAFRPEAFGAATGEPVEPSDPWPPIQESRVGLWRMLPAYVRPIGSTDPAHERVADSVMRRQGADPTYRPPNLVRYLGERPGNPLLS
ncbi:DUF2235 domain-containing protein [Arthrobacter sp. SAFR-044]|uniref:DUF2235 domain-containing protein n=1 Tax=Arthrobacter sp. SAFR-044 TaxID=3387278 RepID=UPI003F7B3A66